MDEIARQHLPDGIEPTRAWVVRAEAWLRSRVEYVYDHDNARLGKPVDEWRTLLPEILRRAERGDDVPVGDDCDAWSFTAIDIAREAGVPFEDLRLVLCLSPIGRAIGIQPLDHMIGAARFDGEWFIIGDTFREGPYPLRDCVHQFYRTHALPLAGHDWTGPDWS